MEKLFSDFEGLSSAKWKEQIIKDLKGIDFNQLIWKTHNGFDVNPFYTGEDLKEKKEPLFYRNDWDICETIMVADEKEANARALKALELGANGLAFHIHKKINTSLLIKTISLEHIYASFNITNDALHVLEDLRTYYAKINAHDGKVKCFVNIDPLHLFAFFGEWHDSEEKDLSALKELKHIPLNIGLYEEAGAGTVNELGIGLSHLIEYLNYLSGNKALSNKKCIHVRCLVAPDFFTEIAKLRALRKLIQLVQAQYDLSLPVHIHAQTAGADKSCLDIYNNMLRTTTEGMSAVIGGADSLSILPYNEGFEKNSEFASRMAINQQHILMNESYLNKVADIAAGSYYIETITDTIAEKAWEQFKTIESKGGFIAGLKNNFIQELVNKGAEELRHEFKEGKLILVGVNKYQNKDEKINYREKEIKYSGSTEIKPIRPLRIAESIEKEKLTGIVNS